MVAVVNVSCTTRLLILSVLVFAAVLAMPRPAQAAETLAPEQVIEQLSDRLLQILETERERLRREPDYVYRLANEILVPHIDFSRVSSLVLGRHWRSATPAQREAFSYQFQRLLVRSYATAFSELSAWELRVLPSVLAPNGRTAAVKAQLVRSQAAPVDLLYSMVFNDGRWMAYDVKIDGISLVTNYRSSFSREVRLKGIDGLIGKITTLNDTRVGKRGSG